MKIERKKFIEEVYPTINLYLKTKKKWKEIAEEINKTFGSDYNEESLRIQYLRVNKLFPNIPEYEASQSKSDLSIVNPDAIISCEAIPGIKSGKYKIPFVFTNKELEVLIILIYSNGNNLKFIKNVSNYLKIVETERLDDRCYKIIISLLETIIDNKITSKEHLLQYGSLFNNYSESEKIDLRNYLQEIVNSEQVFNKTLRDNINNTLTNSLLYYKMQKDLKQINEVDMKFKQDTYAPILFNNLLTSCKNILQISKEVESSINMYDDTINSVSASDRFSQIERSFISRNLQLVPIKTGLQQLNYILGGGFKQDNVILFAGVSKAGKSTILEQICYWAIKYNDFEIPEGRKAGVLYLSLENNLNDSEAREMSYVTDGKGDEQWFRRCNYESDEAFEAFKNKYKLLCMNAEVRGDSCVIREFRQPDTFSVMDLENMLDDYSRQGVDIKLVSIDYIQLLQYIGAPVEKEYIKYEKLMNQLISLASEKHIPIVTASQFNRDGERLIQADSTFREQLHQFYKISAADIADSKKLIDKAYQTIALCRLHDDESDRDAMEFKLLKSREGRQGYCFAQWFKGGIKFEEDEGLSHSKGFQITPDTVVNRDPTRRVRND